MRENADKKNSEYGHCESSILHDNNTNDDNKTSPNIRIKNTDRLIFGNININSISSKFDQLKLVQDKIGLLVLRLTL